MYLLFLGCGPPLHVPPSWAYVHHSSQSFFGCALEVASSCYQAVAPCPHYCSFLSSSFSSAAISAEGTASSFYFFYCDLRVLRSGTSLMLCLPISVGGVNLTSMRSCWEQKMKIAVSHTDLLACVPFWIVAQHIWIVIRYLLHHHRLNTMIILLDFLLNYSSYCQWLNNLSFNNQAVWTTFVLTTNLSLFSRFS